MSAYCCIKLDLFINIDNRKFIVERHDTRSLGVQYLRAIIAYREEGRPVVYADKTYIHSSQTTSYSWDDELGAGLKAPVSNVRLIIVYTGKSTLTLRLLMSYIYIYIYIYIQ